MPPFEPSTIDYKPSARLGIDFPAAAQLEVSSTFKTKAGESIEAPFDFYVLLHFNAGYSTIAVFPQGILSKESELIALDYCIKAIAKSLTDRELGANLLANRNTFTHAPNQLGFNKSVFIYTPALSISREFVYTFFEKRDIRARIRDLIYYEQQWEARRPDVFISHDSADKVAVAEPLYHALTARGLKVWLDKYTLNLGDSLTEKINEGIAECRYGVLILSKAFLANERWAKRELNSFSVKDAIGDSHKLIPVWHGINESDLAAQGNYWLLDKLGGSASDIEKLADDIARLAAKLRS